MTTLIQLVKLVLAALGLVVAIGRVASGDVESSGARIRPTLAPAAARRVASVPAVRQDARPAVPPAETSRD